MENIFTLISVENILALPPLVMGVGLLIIFLSVVRAIRSLFTLRLIKAFTSLVGAFVLAVMLSQAGHLIAPMLGLDTAKTDQSSSDQ